ncbi:EAL domain-containing protein [Pengzhenrongella frigida]|uniref:EAL domain-containing protein n=1 Tax=Pengzhenrongella frigida TaxID=1259133 RepID=A0A4Q5MZS9_9MICO|nr:EAL domain-containing protein [Cellulomonas sp. HLT2-17]RYV51288.1 EAL domain-containing protein [Cellulomonas sp. HLT2-17]
MLISEVGSDPAADREFALLLDRRHVQVVFQPLVDLHSGEIVGLEALARGPAGTQFASPLTMFAAARRAGRVAELDWVCRAAAYQAFLDADLPPAMSLFVNVEPEAIAQPCPSDLTGVVARAESVLRVFVEINDHALAADPAGVLAAVVRARDIGWGVAMDDVGVSRAPIAMLPIVCADLVKLDLRRLADASVVDAAAVISSVLRHVEAIGATLLVEGIETEEDAIWARALGATYGQGHHLGVPAPLLDHYPAPRVPVHLVTPLVADQPFDSPFELLGGRSYQRMDLDVLTRLIAVMALSPRSLGTWPAYLVGMSRDAELPARLTDHIAVMHSSALLWVVFGTAMAAEPVPGVHGVRLHLDDPLADERFFIVLSDQAPTAVFARLCPDGLYDVVVTQDRDLVHAVAYHLIRRMPRPGGPNFALPVHRREPTADDADSTVAKRGWRGRLSAKG